MHHIRCFSLALYGYAMLLGTAGGTNYIIHRYVFVKHAIDMLHSKDQILPITPTANAHEWMLSYLATELLGCRRRPHIVHLFTMPDNRPFCLCLLSSVTVEHLLYLI